MKTATHPSGITITFDPTNHSYADSRGLGPYTSVTRLVHEIFPDPDLSTAATVTASRTEGATPESVRAAWAADAASACTFGTRVHETAEAALLNPSSPPPHQPANDRERAAFSAAWRTALSVRRKSASVHPEAIIFDPASLTAGTADLIALSRDPEPLTTLTILDWKTNKRITTEPFRGAHALPPFAHIPDTHIARYSLQLHLYLLILTANAYVSLHIPHRLVICHFPPLSTTPVFYAATDYSRDAVQIITSRRAHHAASVSLARRSADAFKNTHLENEPYIGQQSHLPNVALRD
jgi:hypothetical protein